MQDDQLDRVIAAQFALINKLIHQEDVNPTIAIYLVFTSSFHIFVNHIDNNGGVLPNKLLAFTSFFDEETLQAIKSIKG